MRLIADLKELWALFHFLCPEVFTAATATLFEDGFDLLRGVIDTNILRKARKLLSLFMLRRIKEEVAIKLPSRREVTILVPLTPKQIGWYKQLLCGLDAERRRIITPHRRPWDRSWSRNRYPAPTIHRRCCCIGICFGVSWQQHLLRQCRRL